MSFARDSFVATNLQTAFTITYSYLQTADNIVTQNGSTLTEGIGNDYTISGSTMTLTTGATTGDIIIITRSTSQNTRLVDYSVPSSLTEGDLDNDSLQAFYMAQESIDEANLSLGRASDGVDWDAESLKIENVATPTTGTDAVNKTYADLATVAGGNVPSPDNPGEDDYHLKASGGTFAWVPPATTLATFGAIFPDLATLGANAADGEFLVGTSAGAFAWETAGTVAESIGPVLADLVTLGAASADGEFIVATAAGVFAYESGSTVAQSIGGITQDLDTLGAPTADGEMIVASASGVFAYETGATLRTSIGAAGLVDANAFTAANTFNDDVILGAASGILETNATFVDVVEFGPALDPVKDWHRKLGASVATELMLATVEDTGADTEVNIWDWTDPTLASATPLATVTITGAATPTSIDAVMGYIIVGSEDGVAIIDPHDGAWAERTKGWPKSLTSTTTPTLTDNDVVDVAAGFSNQPRFDPRTGGPMPTFAVAYGTGADVAGWLKDDGQVFQFVAGSETVQLVAIRDGSFLFTQGGSTTDNRIIEIGPISEIQVDDFSPTAALTENDLGDSADVNTFGAENAIAVRGPLFAGASAEGLALVRGRVFDNVTIGASVNRTYNTGWLPGDIRGAWLANSKTADRSYKANTLTENGTVTEAAAETGAELKCYSGFSAANWLGRADDADYNALGTGAYWQRVWAKSADTSAAAEFLAGIGNAGSTRETVLLWQTSGQFRWDSIGASATVSISSPNGLDDGLWHCVDMVCRLDTDRELYVDGVSVGVSAVAAGSISGTIIARIGVALDDTSAPATTSSLSLHRLSATAPTAAQIRHMYETERRMFEANAKCLLQSGTTDAVLDVNIDKMNSKVAVTQTDDVVVFDGLVIADEPTIAAGGTTWEHYRTYDDDVVEINDANAFASIAAKDVRGAAELLRGERLPKGPDLGRVKAWATTGSAGGFQASYGFSGVSKTAGNGLYDYVFSVPMKNTFYAVVANNTGVDGTCVVLNSLKTRFGFRVTTVEAGTNTNAIHGVAVFGELENE